MKDGDEPNNNEPLSDPSRFKGYLVCLIGVFASITLLLFMLLERFGAAFPPPAFTGSISFDEKAVWLAEHLDRSCEILAIGSSMTVNNLDTSALGGDKMLNAASWGMKMDHIDGFLEVLLEHVTPKTVVVVTAPIDFQRDHRDRELFQRAVLERFLVDGNLSRAHWRLMSMNYLLGSFLEVRSGREGRSQYFSLDFDEGGCVPLDLDSEGFERWPERWSMPVAEESSMDEKHYVALSVMAERCRARGIAFLLVQAPIREAVLTAEDADFLEKRHWPRLAQICEEQGGRFANFHGRLALSDDEFADSTHLNRAGALKLSEAIAEGLGE